MDLLNKAINFAIRAHAGQKYGDKSYIYHLDQVHDIVKEYGLKCRILAYLHDTIEDTGTSIDEIINDFGMDIATLTYLITDEEGSNREGRKELTYFKVRIARLFREKCGELFIVKAADRLANLRECILNDNKRLLYMYKKEHVEFKNVYYISGLCEEIWDEIDQIINT